jgi:hypothetical protein
MEPYTTILPSGCTATATIPLVKFGACGTNEVIKFPF